MPRSTIVSGGRHPVSAPSTSRPSAAGSPGNGRLAFGVLFLVLAFFHQTAGYVTHPVSRLLDLLLFGLGGVMLIRWWHLRRKRFRADPNSDLPGPGAFVLTTGLLGLVCAFGAIDTLLSRSGPAGLSSDHVQAVLGLGTAGAVLLFIAQARFGREARLRAAGGTSAASPAAAPQESPVPASFPAPDPDVNADQAERLEEDETSDVLLNGPRTAWAYRKYQARRDAQGVTVADARLLLAALEPGDHAELILDAVSAELTDIRLAAAWRRSDAEPVVAMRTLRRWVLVSRRTGMVITVDGEVDPGVSCMSDYGINRHDIGWAATLETADGDFFTMKVFLGGRGTVEEAIIEDGAGGYIRRLPPADGVPPMPDAASILADSSQPIAPLQPTARQTMLPVDWRTAEELARAHMRFLGFDDAELTSSGRDGGLDVVAQGAVAQVKMLALPVGAPPIQQLRGARPLTEQHLFYSTSGYTAAAITAADEIGVALFKIEAESSVQEVNAGAVTLVEASARPAEELPVTTQEGLTRHVTRLCGGCRSPNHQRGGQRRPRAGPRRRALPRPVETHARLSESGADRPGKPPRQFPLITSRDGLLPPHRAAGPRLLPGIEHPLPRGRRPHL
ncbi:restriction endonuclease [Actinoplanes sp. Pm04-4]|uniref:Restriction endonuclease n=1 Tax=Paractinoplanes pyxinae TaxID=2997416 RepID=A0ABT4B882_9ACTN|nr:restriction endonuclease [Actinoplanes pyxinae]MCY1142666.1 restriction endonuclease [Actinoplanes pyxinae]